MAFLKRRLCIVIQDYLHIISAKPYSLTSCLAAPKAEQDIL